MRLIVYGDFNCPYSYLASQRADQLERLGIAEVDWRAVEHDPGLPVTGLRTEPAHQDWKAELADVSRLALPGEHVPGAPPAVLSNTSTAIAAYAEAVSDAVQDELRQRVFQAIWGDGRDLSSAREVRGLISAIMAPPVPILPHLSSPDLPHPILSDPDPTTIVRRSGGTIGPDGSPMTTAAYRRIRYWRQEWQAISQVVPVVIAPDGACHPGIAGLEYLAGPLRDLPALPDRARRDAAVSDPLRRSVAA